MSITGRIRAFQLVFALAVTAMAAFAYANLRASNYSLERVQFAQQQLNAMSQLAIDANRYSEQIAELLLIGEPERPDFASARAEVSASFGVLRQRTVQEAAFIEGRDEQGEEKIELERLDRMQAPYREIDRAVERLLLLNQQGRPDEAIRIFRAEIENRLDAEFTQLMADGLADEQEEVWRVEAEAMRLTNLLAGATLAACGVMLVIALISGIRFARSMVRPINALTEGALAIEQGEFNHRIPHKGRDEHALLAQRFNAMAEQLGRQRAMLVAAQGELEGQVAERTEQLAEANRRLIATDQQRVRLLTDVSHELRTPLTALRGEAEIALRGASKPEAVYREALSAVVARAADLARLVEDLLFLARADAEELRFDFRRVQLNEIAAEAVKEAGILGRDRQIRINFDDHDRPVLVRGDQRRLKQVILIVLDNAVRYASSSSTVDVALRRDDLSAVLLVSDRGPGIAPGEIEKVFERFYRGANARGAWDGGSGLGLPIARWIVEKHEGAISISSRLGEGTEVQMRVPVLP